MDLPGWIIEESKDVIKSRKKYRSDKPVCVALDKYIQMLIHEGDPAVVAYETTKEDFCILRLTRAVRLSYWVDYEKRTICLSKLGDHKEVYGRD